MALELIAPILIVVATSAGISDAAVLMVAALVVLHVCLGATMTLPPQFFPKHCMQPAVAFAFPTGRP